ncbi:MAG: hypothetical protein GY774_22170, partial [Planctomycetes bacterium]|nr:hypothetical protein [Planctomycetota bacterium]
KLGALTSKVGVVTICSQIKHDGKLTGNAVSFENIYLAYYSERGYNYADAVCHYLNTAELYIDEVDCDFESLKNEVMGFFGYELMNRLCQGRVNDFVSILNHTCNSAGNEWTMRESNKGMFGYKYAATLLVNGLQAGLVAWGALNNGCYISFSGVGMAAIDVLELYKVLDSLEGINITRVDLAHDDLNGAMGYDEALHFHKTGGFKTKGRPPKLNILRSGACEYDENGEPMFEGGST